MDAFLVKVNTYILNPAIGFIFAAALVYFLWGVFQFLSNQENEDKRTAGKSHMFWGIIGLTIMMGVWTILRIVTNTLNISPSEIDPEQGKVNLNPYVPPARTN